MEDCRRACSAKVGARPASIAEHRRQKPVASPLLREMCGGARRRCSRSALDEEMFKWRNEMAGRRSQSRLASARQLLPTAGHLAPSARASRTLIFD
jgi:hypothetical protein